MIAKLVCAGVDAFKEIYAPDENEILVGVDGGALKIIEAGYKPKIAIGDFDSGNLLLIARHAERMIIHPEKKDHGDLELAIQEIAPLEPEKILIFDSTGGRLDHFLAALNILICFSDLNIEILDERNSIFLIKEEAEILPGKYKYCSFFAVEAGTVISLSGFKYNLKDHPFPPFDNLCLSNEVETKGRVRTNKKIIAVRSF